MLNKRICRKCINSRDDTSMYPANEKATINMSWCGWKSSDDAHWRGGQVACRVTHPGRIYNIMNGPPPWCFYHLEQTMIQEKKC